YRTAAVVFERFARFLWLHGHYADLRSCAEAVAAAARAAGDEVVEARARAVVALVLHVRGQYLEAAEALRRSAETLDRLDDRPGLAWTLANLAVCLIVLSRPAESVTLAERARDLFEEDDFGALCALRARSAALNRLDRSAEAVLADAEAL